MSDQPALRFKDRLSILLLRCFSTLPLGFLRRFGALVGRLAASTGNGTRRTVATNLALCFPDQDAAWRARVTRDSLVSTGMTAMEFAKTWGMPTAYSIDRIRRVHNEQLLHDYLAEGKGLIGIIPHWGTWEFMNAWMNQHTHPVIMYKPGKQPGVDAFVAEARGRLRATVVPTDDSGVRATFKALKQGGFTAILPDHIPGPQGGVFAPFFGIDTWTGVMVPKLASRTGCRVIIMGCVRQGDGFDIHFLPGDPDIGHTDTALGAAAMNRSMERLIRLAPEQYQWTYKRFKKNASLADPYRR